MSKSVIHTTSELLTVDQFAQLLKVSRTTVFSWLNTGVLLEGIHYIRFGRVLRFRWVTDLFFKGKSQKRIKHKTKKQSTAPEQTKASSISIINLDYGL